MTSSPHKKVGSIMVVGAGIAGMQAALDLADAGFKVYLVDRTSSIGGRMTQLDKTFPTNDCSMCTISPRLVECEKHLNIELMTYSEVEDVSGDTGNFKANIRRKARYIDEDKCTGCVQCVEHCPVQFKPVNGNGTIVADEAVEPRIKASVDAVIDRHIHERGPLVSVLQDINLEFGYLPPEVLRYVSIKLHEPLATVYHVATFYTAFSLVPRGERIIRVCMGTACYARGASRILETLENRLEIKAGQTTEDMKFTLETVNCLGACALGPVVVVDDMYHGQATVNKVERLLKEYQESPEESLT